MALLFLSQVQASSVTGIHCLHHCLHIMMAMVIVGTVTCLHGCRFGDLSSVVSLLSLTSKLQRRTSSRPDHQGAPEPFKCCRGKVTRVELRNDHASSGQSYPKSSTTTRCLCVLRTVLVSPTRTPPSTVPDKMSLQVLLFLTIECESSGM